MLVSVLMTTKSFFYKELGDLGSALPVKMFHKIFYVVALNRK